MIAMLFRILIVTSSSLRQAAALLCPSLLEPDESRAVGDRIQALHREAAPLDLPTAFTDNPRVVISAAFRDEMLAGCTTSRVVPERPPDRVSSPRFGLTPARIDRRDVDGAPRPLGTRWSGRQLPVGFEGAILSRGGAMSTRAVSRTLILSVLAVLVLASAAVALEVGQKAPDFTLSGTDGKPVKLSDLTAKGPVVIYTFIQAFTGT
jgi:hypothetical protein